ncbi:hypothetical protein [Aquitalea magnusonii]|uniref:hypothetical protein n=1 Tax=Aquitalea magnusonii TaxID=332411 RepID=UPI00128F958E|nr:hypothetical protein [Aquitalea magnusonii]
MVRSSAYRMGLNSDTMLKTATLHDGNSMLAASITEMPAGQAPVRQPGRYKMTNEQIAALIGSHGSKPAAYCFFIIRFGTMTSR